ncbi:hypothetical protein ITI46_14025 [Streptomyces oryzae]|uniref:Gram-positive cocci surface proteins LPxTG domain-containing protein n=1 Tax=Streptomyces oryzae TaxID=1434886 RepID=A0ABS3XBL8_9ACTN|nr:hypothetical protein [Streptomyces oryzae]
MRHTQRRSTAVTLVTCALLALPAPVAGAEDPHGREMRQAVPGATTAPGTSPGTRTWAPLPEPPDLPAPDFPQPPETVRAPELPSPPRLPDVPDVPDIPDVPDVPEPPALPAPPEPGFRPLRPGGLDTQAPDDGKWREKRADQEEERKQQRERQEARQRREKRQEARREREEREAREEQEAREERKAREARRQEQQRREQHRREQQEAERRADEQRRGEQQQRRRQNEEQQHQDEQQRRQQDERQRPENGRHPDHRSALRPPSSFGNPTAPPRPGQSIGKHDLYASDGADPEDDEAQDDRVAAQPSGQVLPVLPLGTGMTLMGLGLAFLALRLRRG